MTKRTILAGGGHAHLAVLADWALRSGKPGERWLVTSDRYTAYSGMLPGWLAGRYHARELFIDLAPIAERASANLVLADVVGLDARARMLKLSNGQHIGYDLLSLATGGEPNVAGLAALGDRLLPAKPVPAFISRWRDFVERTDAQPSVNVGVVGGGAAGVELALGAYASLRRHHRQARVSLISAEGHFMAGHADGVRQRALAALGDRGIAVHHATGAAQETGLILPDGSHLAIDCVIAATGSRAPRWLASSGLACDGAGFVKVGADLRSENFHDVFAAGDIVERTDRPVARSGVHAVKAGPVLAANLRATLEGRPLRHYRPRKRTLYLLSTGDGRAILSWGQMVVMGKWVWRLKDRIDRKFVERHRPVPDPRADDRAELIGV